MLLLAFFIYGMIYNSEREEFFEKKMEEITLSCKSRGGKIIYFLNGNHERDVICIKKESIIE